MAFKETPNRNLYAAPRRAFPRCGFHNRTVAELNNEPDRKRDARLLKSVSGVAAVDDIFGSININGKMYTTKLWVAERHFPPKLSGNGSRGFTVVDLKPISEGEDKFIFTIYLDSKICNWNPETKEAERLDILCERTFVFAMEMLSAYKIYLLKIEELVSGMNPYDVVQVLSIGDKGDHPVEEDAHRLICSRSAICRALSKFIEIEKQSDPDFDLTDLNSFINLSTHAPERLSRYYDVWRKDHRVSATTVMRKTLEFFVAQSTPTFPR
jgi:hypothetical protein